LASQFPKIIKDGVQSVLFIVFLCENTAGSLTLGDSIISTLCQYPASNNLMFGWKATNKPEPCHLKKVVLMLVAANILGFVSILQMMMKKRNILLYLRSSLKVIIGLY
jgi:glycine cleavage system regulatory protein